MTEPLGGFLRLPGQLVESSAELLPPFSRVFTIPAWFPD